MFNTIWSMTFMLPVVLMETISGALSVDRITTFDVQPRVRRPFLFLGGLSVGVLYSWHRKCFMMVVNIIILLLFTTMLW